MADALRANGVDEVSVARKLKDLLEDEDPKIRLDASRECLKLLEAYPVPTPANGPNVQLIIYTPQQKSLSDYSSVEVRRLGVLALDNQTLCRCIPKAECPARCVDDKSDYSFLHNDESSPFANKDIINILGL
jgi:hypothetical protein